MNVRRWIHQARTHLVGVVLLGAAMGCAADPGSGSRDPEPSPTVSVTIRMGPDGPELPEDAVAELQAYGARHPDEFAGLYVDNQANSSFVMLFTDRLDEHAAAIAEIWPRVTVRGARYSEAELVALLDSLDLSAMAGEGIEPISAGLDTMNNRLFLELKSNDPTLELRLELEYGGRVDVTVHPLPGPWANAEEGPGWRLLGAGSGSHEDAYLVRAAKDQASWESLWSAVGLEGARPEVDLEDEVVVSFGHGIGSSCPELRLDGVRIDGGAVFSATSDPLAPRGCTADLVGSVVFVVALDRAALPAGGFTLQLTEAGGPGDPLEVDLP